MVLLQHILKRSESAYLKKFVFLPSKVNNRVYIILLAQNEGSRIKYIRYYNHTVGLRLVWDC